jgi:hypothetical protein
LLHLQAISIEVAFSVVFSLWIIHLGHELLY